MLLIHKAQHTFCAQYISQLQIPINISILVAYHGGGGKYVYMRLFFPSLKKKNIITSPIYTNSIFSYEEK